MADARTPRPTVFPRLAVALATLFSLLLFPSLPGGPVEAALPGPQEGRPDFFVLEDLYRKLLAAWASEPETGVLGAAQLGIDLAWRSRCLDAVVENTARRLGQESREALLSVAHLHAELYLWHASQLDLREAGQTSVRLRRIVDLVVESTDEPEAAAPALDLLLHVATSAIQDRYPQELVHARELLNHLLKLEPGSPRALAWLAFLDEIEDRPARAVRRLEDLREVAPEDPELPLRVALNLLRSGREERGEALLAELADPHKAVPHVGWVQVVALEELARLWAERGEREAARELLEAGLERAPHDQGLVTLLAFLQPTWSEADAVLRRFLADWHGDPGPGPRLRYENGPQHHLTGLARRLAAALEGTRAELGRALSQLEHLDEMRLHEMEQRLEQGEVRRLLASCQRILHPIAGGRR